MRIHLAGPTRCPAAALTVRPNRHTNANRHPNPNPNPHRHTNPNRHTNPRVPNPACHRRRDARALLTCAHYGARQP
jgi:hypothetical protein